MIAVEQGVHAVSACAIVKGTEPWLFAERERGAIDQHWRRRVAEMPAFFNGTVFIMTHATVSSGVLAGTLAQTSFASSLYWREARFADTTVVDCFGSAVLLSADGALIYGRQLPGHVNSGLIYPPSGFIDKRDVGPDGRFDVDASVARELGEETGLDPSALKRDPDYLAIRDGQLLAVAVVYRLPELADAVIETVGRFLATTTTPELECLVALRRCSDIDAHPMPGYARRLALAFLSE